MFLVGGGGLSRTESFRQQAEISYFSFERASQNEMGFYSAGRVLQIPFPFPVLMSAKEKDFPGRWLSETV